jgi:predicted secreted protein
MKKNSVIALIPFVLLVGCAGAPQQKPIHAPAKISFSENDFRTGSPHKTNDITVASGEKLAILLGSNPSTGYTWGEKAVNSDPTVVGQLQHQYIGPTNPVPGNGGTESWTFEALKAGGATLDFSYGQPWQGGDKRAWTLQVRLKIQ